MSEEPELEVIVERSPNRSRRTSLLFVHGINVGAWVWQPHFLPYFAAAGFDTFAVSLRGHGKSAGQASIRNWRLRDYVRDVVRTVAQIDGPVVLVGHSMGGAVVQQYVRDGAKVDGMALLAAVPPWGLGSSAMHMALTAPGLAAQLSGLLSGDRPTFDAMMLRDALFSRDVPSSTLETFARHVGPESPALAIELQGWPPIGPLPWQAPATLVIGAGNDRLIPPGEIWRTGLYYGTSAAIIPNLAHAIMAEPRWQVAADHLRDWLLARFD